LSQFERTICDPLYGLIQLTQSELSMLKSMTVARMRWIKQMGLACLVFPGANHTRYEHSLGTMFVAKRLVDALIRKTQNSFVEENAKAIEFAGLLHDLGHSPFSHVTEEFFRKNPNYLPTTKLSYDHEEYTETIIQNDKTINDVCKKEKIDVNFLSKLAIGKSETFLDILMSSAVDVDKIDYVSRDSYFCGLPYGRIDLSALEDGIFISEFNSGNIGITFHNKNRYVLEGILTSRFYLSTIIHINEKNCAANQILLKGIKKAYDVILEAAEPRSLEPEVKKLILESLHFQWVDHDLVTLLQDPMQRLKFAAIEAIRTGFSSLSDDTLHEIADLKTSVRAKQHFSHKLLNRVLQGKTPNLQSNIPLVKLQPSAKYDLYVVDKLFPYTNYLNYLKNHIHKLETCRNKIIYVDISSPKNVEINAKIVVPNEELKTLYDLSPLMRGLNSEINNRISLRIFSNKHIDEISIPEIESILNRICRRARKRAVKKKQYMGSDIILLVYYYLHSEKRKFFEGDTRFQALFSYIFSQIFYKKENPYKELAELQIEYGDLSKWHNYDKFIQEAYPEFFSVNFVQDLATLTEMGLLYTRSKPILLVSEYRYPLRNERRISGDGIEYVENNLLDIYPFSNKILKIIKKCLQSKSSLIRLAK